jgi:hypothetical protein
MSTLDSWLNDATRCLSKDSAAQVRSEIGEHYEASREAAVQSGANDADAGRAAVAALGDARKANREYREVLLTSEEAKLLRQGNREAQFVCANRHVWLALASLPGLTLIASGLLLYTGKLDLARALLAVGMALSFLFVVPKLPIYTASRSRAVRIMKWILLAALPVLAFGRDTLSFMWLVGSCWWVIGWIEWRREMIRRKLPIAQWPKQLYL